MKNVRVIVRPRVMINALMRDLFKGDCARLSIKDYDYMLECIRKGQIFELSLLDLSFYYEEGVLSPYVIFCEQNPKAQRILEKWMGEDFPKELYFGEEDILFI